MRVGTNGEIEREALRLHEKLGKLGWSMDTCRISASLTLEINRLKREKNAIILAHSYQSPDIIFGVADFTGDSYGLSKEAMGAKAGIIVFSGVRFMAETAKILNPEKRVFIPSTEAGCSLADGITAEDVRSLKKEHPGCPVVCYVNTSAEVKAESEICCTSANAEKVVSSLPQSEIIFVPDSFMAKNVAKRTGKKLIPWSARCVVHADIDPLKIGRIRGLFGGASVLAHSECPPEIAAISDMVGGTTDMEKYVSGKGSGPYFLLTECGLADRLRAKFPEKEFVGSCSLCPYMKKNSLQSILRVLKALPSENEIKVDPQVSKKARLSLEAMLKIA